VPSVRTPALLATLALAGGAVAALLWLRRAEADLEVTELRTASPSRVPVLRVRARSSPEDRPIALLVHGSQCNKGMMAPLAKDLALNGFDAWAIDLPGHGASDETFTEERAYLAAREALEWILAERGVEPGRVALVGHSYGAKVVGRLAVVGGRYATTVLVGPTYGGGFSEARPADLLVLTAERDPPFIQSAAVAIARDATGGAAAGPFGERGDPFRGDRRRWREVPGADHLSLLASPEVRRDAVAWVARGVGLPPAEVRLASPAASTALVLVAVAAAAALAALAARVSRSLLAPPARAPALSRLRPAIAAAAGGALALLAARATVPLRVLRLAEGDVLGSALFLAGVATTVLAALLCREHLPTPSQVVRGLPVAVVASALLYVAAAPLSDRALYHLSFDGAPARAAAAVVLAACMFPLFAFAEGVLDAIRRAHGNGAGAHLRALAVAAPCCAAAAWSLALAAPGLGRFAAPAAAAALLLALLGGVVSAAAANFAAGAAFSAIATAWLVAVGFVRF
jgi:pimeloyl-ACP methyl ester carboxylesterase